MSTDTSAPAFDMSRIVAASNLLIEAGERFGADTPAGFAIFVRVVDAVVERFRRQLPAPAPAPVEPDSSPWFPEPADFPHQTSLGDFDGEPLEGLLMWQEETGEAKPYAVRTTIGGVEICILPALDADDTATINVNRGAGQTCMGDIDLADLGALIELHQSGALPRLIEMARRFVAEPAERRAA